MNRPIQLTEDQVEFLRLVLEETRDQAQDHLIWLRSPEAETEEDKDRQVAESERSVELSDQILKTLTD